jgi:hypothetical protein
MPSVSVPFMKLDIAYLRRAVTSVTVIGLIASPALARTSIKSAPTEAIDRAAKGVVAQIEDDVAKKGDWMFQSVRTTGCTSIVTAKPINPGGDGALGRWTIDWATAEAVQMQYNFVYIKAPGLQFAIVGNGKAKATRKLAALAQAMQVKMGACLG